jgi:putative GTP pyrophosphokinase
MLNQSEILQNAKIDKKDFISSKLAWEELEAIHSDYIVRMPELADIGLLISNQLQKLPDVHSVRMRVKNPEHLITKIIRKALKQPDRVINLSNYLEQVTDLVGVRALHLFKSNWDTIQQFIEKTWDRNEQPKAYVRAGDSLEANEVFNQAGFAVEEHPSGYRSLHFNIKTQPGKTLYIAELQVRTIFEEGWSEIDHTIKYPHNTANSVINEFLMLFNRMAGSADEMGSFIQLLQYDAAQKDSEVQTLKNRIDKLEMKPEEKVSLKKSVDSISSFGLESISHGFGGSIELTNAATRALTGIEGFSVRNVIGSRISTSLDDIIAFNRTERDNPKSLE